MQLAELPGLSDGGQQTHRGHDCDKNDGRSLSGPVIGGDANHSPPRPATEQITITDNDIELIEESTPSTITDGLPYNLSDEHVAELIAYFMFPAQVCLP